MTIEQKLEDAVERVANHLRTLVFNLKPDDCTESIEEIKIEWGALPMDSELEAKPIYTVSIRNYDEPMYIAEFVEIGGRRGEEEVDEFAVVEDPSETKKITLKELDSGKTAFFKAMAKIKNKPVLYPSDMKIFIEPRVSTYVQDPEDQADFSKHIVQLVEFPEVELTVFLKKDYLSEKSIRVSQSNLKAVSRRLQGGRTSARNSGIFGSTQGQSTQFVSVRSSMMKDMSDEMNLNSALDAGFMKDSSSIGHAETPTENFVNSVIRKGDFKKKVGNYNLKRVVLGGYSMIEVNPIGNSQVVCGGFMDSVLHTDAPYKPESLIEEGAEAEESESQIFESCRNTNFNGYIDRRLNLVRIQELFENEDQIEGGNDAVSFTMNITKSRDTNFDRPINRILDEIM